MILCFGRFWLYQGTRKQLLVAAMQNWIKSCFSFSSFMWFLWSFKVYPYQPNKLELGAISTYFARQYSAVFVQIWVYGCFLHPQFDHPLFFPPRFSNVTHCHRWSNSVATYFVTERQPQDGIEGPPTGSKSKRPTPCAIHGCELDHSWWKSKWLGPMP